MSKNANPLSKMSKDLSDLLDSKTELENDIMNLEKMIKNENWIIMYCPKCFAISEIDINTIETIPYRSEDFNFEGENRRRWNECPCNCNEDYIYLEEISKKQMLISFAKRLNNGIEE